MLCTINKPPKPDLTLHVDDIVQCISVDFIKENPTDQTITLGNFYLINDLNLDKSPGFIQITNNLGILQWLPVSKFKKFIKPPNWKSIEQWHRCEKDGEFQETVRSRCWDFPDSG